MIKLIPIGIVLAILVFSGPKGCSDSSHHNKKGSSASMSQADSFNQGLIALGYFPVPDSNPNPDPNPMVPPNPGPDHSDGHGTNPEVHQVPGPLGVAALPALIVWVRKLRRRIKEAAQ